MKALILIAIGVLTSAIYYNVPKKSIIPVTITGITGYFIANLINDLFSLRYLGLFIGVIGLGLLAGYFARKLKLPTTVFFQAGIVPLVPGGALYRMMYNMVFENYSEAVKNGSEAIMVAGILAIGIYLTSAISDLLKIGIPRFRRKKNNG